MFSSVSHNSLGCLFLRTLLQPIYCGHNWSLYYAVVFLSHHQIETSCLICIYSVKPSPSNTASWIGLVMGYGFGEPNTNFFPQTIEETLHIGHRFYWASHERAVWRRWLERHTWLGRVHQTSEYWSSRSSASDPEEVEIWQCTSSTTGSHTTGWSSPEWRITSPARICGRATARTTPSVRYFRLIWPASQG